VLDPATARSTLFQGQSRGERPLEPIKIIGSTQRTQQLIEEAAKLADFLFQRLDATLIG
jgi:hypothetical protein